MLDALKPLEQEINRLEKEYGLDRPLHQMQFIMLDIGDILAIKAAIAKMRSEP